jgi:predicted O-linked N-acetylglucosamine transferase (SPINDLY family)
MGVAQEEAPLHRAIALQNAGETVAAAALLREVLGTEPDNAAALYSLAVIAVQGGQPDEALRLLDRALPFAAGFAPLHFARGTALQALGRRDEALAAYDAALAIEPRFAEALINSGALLRELLRHGEALERFNRVLGFDPDHVAALANCAILLTEFRQHADAIARFERLLALAPEHDWLPGLLLYEQLQVCDWTQFDALRARIVDGVRAGRRVCKSLALMAITDDAADQQTAARLFASHTLPPGLLPLWTGERRRHHRLRIAYVSPDLREHPVGHLMAGVFEAHDRMRFETIAISLGPDDGSRLRQRIARAFDRFVDARAMGSAQIAARMHAMEVDIAVDLAGWTADSRMEVFARRPAPVQVGFLGYPGTCGTRHLDYLIADRHVIPPHRRDRFDERVVYLPDAYLPVDASLRPSTRVPTRAECGLPERPAFVFCAFSHDYKLSPPTFDAWMRLLAAIDGSVLWLVSRSEASKRNLRAAAAARGVDPERLVFAGRVPAIEDHLARYAQADLFLDTHPYNAHTTAADALLAGLPVLTWSGDAMPSRVAGSLLHAVGLPELVTGSLADYEALALALARDPARLAGLRARLAAARDTAPLFDTRGFCRDLEAAYLAMWRHRTLGDEAGP